MNAVSEIARANAGSVRGWSQRRAVDVAQMNAALLHPTPAAGICQAAAALSSSSRRPALWAYLVSNLNYRSDGLRRYDWS